MNEDKRGITPADVTSISVQNDGPGYLVIIERGNADDVLAFHLTYMERAQLGMILPPGAGIKHVEFADHTRPLTAGGKES